MQTFCGDFFRFPCVQVERREKLHNF